MHQEIIRRLKVANIYSLLVDGTKDRGHKNQMTIILRYIENDKPVERFITFLENQGHKAKDMFDGD